MTKRASFGAASTTGHVAVEADAAMDINHTTEAKAMDTTEEKAKEKAKAKARAKAEAEAITPPDAKTKDMPHTAPDANSATSAEIQSAR